MPCGPITCQRIVVLRHFRDIRDGHQTGRRAFGEFLQPIGQRPQHKPQTGRRGFQQKRLENGVLTEADAMLAQLPTGILIKGFHLFSDALAWQKAQTFDQTEGKAPRKARQRLIPAHGQEGFKMRGDLAVDEMLQTAAHFFGDIGARVFIDEGFDLRTQGIGTGNQLADRGRAPHQASLLGEIKFRIRSIVEAVRPKMEFRFQRLNGCRAQGPRLIRGGTRVLTKPEPFQLAHEFPFDSHFAFVIHLGHKALLLLQSP